MAVKAEYNALVHLLQYTLSERNRSFFPAVALDFAEDGVHVRQTDDAKIVAVILDIDRDYFMEYTPLGRVYMNAGKILDVLADHFKRSPWVEIDVQETSEGQMLVLRGEGVKYREPMLDVPVDEPKFEKMRDWQGIPYLVAEDYDLVHVYEFDTNILRTVKKKWETIWFNAGPEGLVFQVEYQGGYIEKGLPAKVLKAGDKTVRFGMAATHVATLAKALPPLALMAVVANSEGTPGPITIYAEGQKHRQTYFYVPQV